MTFSGEALRRALLKQSNRVSVFDWRGSFRGSVQASDAAELAALYGLVGIGRPNRIYDIQPSEMRPRLDRELLGRNPAARRPAPITKNITPAGDPQWKPRLDKARTGSFGASQTIHFRRLTT
jgi:hypothetical protein